MATAERIQTEEPVEPVAEAQEKPEVETPSEPELPKKFQNKTKAEIAESYAELEKAYGRQGQEMGELRKWTDTLISNTTKPSQETSDPKEESIDFDADPAEATKQLIRKELANAIKPLQEQAGMSKAESVRNQLQANHPGYEDTINDPAFANWVASSPVRSELYKRADEKLEYAAIDELLNTYNALHAKKDEDRTQQLKAATLESAGTGESPSKVYKRTELIKLKVNDPEAYAMQQDEIQLAYAEGRVK